MPEEYWLGFFCCGGRLFAAGLVVVTIFTLPYG